MNRCWYYKKVVKEMLFGPKYNYPRFPELSLSELYSYHEALPSDTIPPIPDYLDMVILPIYYEHVRVTIKYAGKKARRLNVPMSDVIVASAAKLAFMDALLAIVDNTHIASERDFVEIHLARTWRDLLIPISAVLGRRGQEIMYDASCSVAGAVPTSKTKYIFYAPTADQMEEHWCRFSAGQVLIPPDMDVNW
jgi:hypothetical protein